MLKDVTAVEPLDNGQLYLQFEDGVEGVVSLTELIDFTGIFAPLRQPDYFARVRVDPELGTICWPNGADIDPDVLYSQVTGEPIEVMEPTTQ